MSNYSHEIVESDIDFNNIDVKFSLLDSSVFFLQSSYYRNYFAATGISLNEDSILIISSRARIDDEFGNTDFVSKIKSNSLLAATETLFKSNNAPQGLVTPSIIKVDGVIQFYYLKGYSYSDASIEFIESRDNGRTWSAEKKVSKIKGFNGLINDRVVRLTSGRIIVPVAYTKEILEKYDEQHILCYYSDDKGQSWNVSNIISAYIPLMEPCIAEIAAGHLLMVIRSRTGKLLFTESFDEGITWSEIKKSKINSPASTSSIYNMGNNKILLIWNHSIPSQHVRDRNPLTFSVSEDGGKSWSKPNNIASTPGEMYSSPSIINYKGNLWIVYNRSANAASYDIVGKLLRIN